MPDRALLFDTVSISNFLLAQAETLLVRLHPGKLFVPVEVYDEVSSGMTSFPRLKKLDSLLQKKAVKTVTLRLNESPEFQSLIGNLGTGEAACIAMAGKRPFTVVTDDRAARNECRSRSVACTGTIGMLKSACRKKIVDEDEADALLVSMVRAGFYFPVKSISSLL